MASRKIQKKALMEAGYASLMIVIGVILPLTISNHYNAFKPAPLYALELVALLGLGLQFLSYLTKTNRRLLTVYFWLALAFAVALSIISVSN